MKPPRKLQREWYGKLKAFPELLDEGPDGEGQLSDRGHLHPVAESQEEDARLALRVEDGAAYTEWAESVLHHGPGFRVGPRGGQRHDGGRTAREVWSLHAAGVSEREIGTTLTIRRRSVRKLLSETRARVSKVSNKKRWQNAKRQRTAQIKALVTRSDPRILAKLVAVMMLHQARGSRSGS